jgi:cytochrome b6-f complex iron-sulfur subunit
VDHMSEEQTPKRRLPEIKPVERRTFLRYSLIGSTAAGLGFFGLSALGFLWPRVGEGFGAELVVGNAQEILNEVTSERAPFRFPEGRLYVVHWDPSASGAEAQYGEDHTILDDSNGLMAIFQRCVHLGCTVPWCQSSQWFECPCHGSRYNRWGEYTDGPAPRGLDRFPSQVDDNGDLVVDTAVVLTGPSRTGNVLQQSPEGPACIDA